MNLKKTHIYLVPGLAASPKIFEHLTLPTDRFELHYLEWLIPTNISEPIEAYAQRMSAGITEPNPVIIGISFGGILAQEMSKYIKDCRVVIISSVKSRHELPRRLKFIKNTRAYKLFPSHSINTIEEFALIAFGSSAPKRIEMYKKYLAVRNPLYLNWAIYNVLHWKQEEPSQVQLHIHGSDDSVFPIKHIANCEIVNGGTHVMILHKAKTISLILTASL